MIAIANPQIRAQSKSTLALQATITYDGSHGSPVYLSATACNLEEPLPWVTGAPVAIPGGTAGAPVSLTLAFSAPDPGAPLGVTSDSLVLRLAPAEGSPLAQVRVAYIRQWYRDLPCFRPADLAGQAFSADPVSSGLLWAAYDGDEIGGILLARPRGGGLVALAVQAGPALTVLRWVDTTVPAGAGGARPVHSGYVVPPGGLVDLAAGQGVSAADAADAIWEPTSGPDSPLHLRPLNGVTLATLRTPVMLPLAATRVFGHGNPHEGTGRSWDEIRDLFDNCDEDPARAGFSVDDLWAPAGIELRITLRRDIRIADNWAHELPATSLRAFSAIYNRPAQLNVYFLRSVEGARAWGAPDREPGAAGQQGALWIGDRCGGAPPDCWTEDVITVAHEAGHFLSLAHCCDDTSPTPCRPGDERSLMYGDGTTADSRQLSAAEIFHARQRAWAYRP